MGEGLAEGGLGLPSDRLARPRRPRADSRPQWRGLLPRGPRETWRADNRVLQPRPEPRLSPSVCVWQSRVGSD